MNAQLAPKGPSRYIGIFLKQGLFLVPLNIRCRNIIDNQQGPIILRTTQYGIYFGPKEVPIYLLQGPSIYHIATWALWVCDSPQNPPPRGVEMGLDVA